MPFSIPSGVYTPPDGAEDAVPGAVIRSATWNTIFTDLSTALTQIGQVQVPATRNLQGTIGQAQTVFISRGISFSSASVDYGIPIILPTGITNYRVVNAQISQATGTLSTATFGVFTSPAGGGVTVVASQTAITIISNLPNTNNNFQNATPVNNTTQSYNVGTLYFRVQVPQPGTAFANVSIVILSLS